MERGRSNVDIFVRWIERLPRQRHTTTCCRCNYCQWRLEKLRADGGWARLSGFFGAYIIECCEKIRAATFENTQNYQRSFWCNWWIPWATRSRTSFQNLAQPPRHFVKLATCSAWVILKHFLADLQSSHWQGLARRPHISTAQSVLAHYYLHALWLCPRLF